MGTVKPLIDSTLVQRSKHELSPATLFWKRQFKSSARVIKEYSPVNHLDLQAQSGELLTTTNSRLALYSVTSPDVRRTYNTARAQQIYGANYRKPDYRLFTCSTGDGRVLVYDASANKPLRILGERKEDAHQAPVHFSTFFGQSEIVSFSDDNTVRLWDLAGGRFLSIIGKHQDYVRSGCIWAEAGLVVSGSYDHTVRLWDARTPDSAGQSVQQFQLPHPVESICIRKSLLFAASEKSVHVFDLIARRSLATLSNIHSKNVTCTLLHDNFLLTGSLDGQLKIFDQNYRQLHFQSFAPCQVLSMCSSPLALVLGTSDGQVHARKFSEQFSTQSTNLKKSQTVLPATSYIDETRISVGSKVVQVRKEPQRHAQLMAHDRLLLEFRFSDALDCVLLHAQNRPEMVVSLMQELIRRDALHIALAGRSDAQVRRLLSFVNRHLTNTRYSRTLIDVAILLSELYTARAATSPELAKNFARLGQLINGEIQLVEQIKMLQGEIDLVVENMTNQH